ncbi:MAG: ECF transporter S component [Prevotellaceae bacterium]|jgi:hypothetical protein|nr:ECF transporter S component [Prevotellaceae bacterium]
MTPASVRFYSFGYNEAKTYLAASLFAVGNIALPQLFHLVPQGGMTWLPIYFFTLIAAYKYGWKVGLLTAILSPLVNSTIFGMPALASLPAILIKSMLLAVAASLAAKHFGKVTILLLLGVVLSYQVVGSLAEWLITASFNAATQDFRMAIPGMLLQVLGGYAFIRFVLKK